MSGGEQQMLAIGRALMAHPELLLLDEPSMGLSPILVEQIFDIVKEINSRGTTVLLVEQNALMALASPIAAMSCRPVRSCWPMTRNRITAKRTVRKAYLGEDLNLQHSHHFPASVRNQIRYRHKSRLGTS